MTYPIFTFVWIMDGVYNLLDADLHKLPREGWQVNQNKKLVHPNIDIELTYAEGSQPSDPYLHNFGF